LNLPESLKKFKMFKNFLKALGFLTLFPLPQKILEEKELAPASSWFPVVGYLLGAIYFYLAKFLSAKFPSELISLVILILMVLLTGALHLDGLADWADSLGGKNPEERLKIMKEPQIGSFGALGLLIVLLGKFSALKILILQSNLLPIFFIPGLARFGLCLLLFSLPYLRETGLGKAFIFKQSKYQLWLAFLFTLFPLVIFPFIKLWILLGISFLVFIGFRALTLKLFEGFTGDILGAGCELCEMVLLLSACFLF